MDNMELFNEYTAKILAQLYESFPLVSHGRRRPVERMQAG